MNSSYGKSGSKTGSINAFDFDLGLGSGRGKPLKDQKTQTTSYSSSTPSWTPQPNKPAWTHKPMAPAATGGTGSLSGPTSMVGDIFGKTWNSSASSNSSGFGIVNNNNPNLFGDLYSSAIGQNKSSSNVPLKNSAPATAANANRFSMGSMADSLPKTGHSSGNTGAPGTNVNNIGGTVDYSQTSGVGAGNANFVGGSNRNPNLGGSSMKSMAGGGVGGGGTGSNKDPFGSLVDFSSKPVGGMKSASKHTDSNSGLGNDPFGAFQSNTSKANGTTPEFSSAGSSDPFGDFSFQSNQTNTSKAKCSTSSFSSPANNSDPLGDFGFPSSQTQPPIQSSGANDFDTLFSGSAASGGFTNQQFSEGDDWGINSEFDGGNDAGGTTEIEGLPPPPSGVSAPTAKTKGMDNYKQGQFADAIKWLSWAVILLEKAGNKDGTMEVLICRASCYKEVGEYKKAVADCTKVLEGDSNNVPVLVQRALLYESMEKYKLGAEDLRTVMKIDPGNRVARSTIHRLTKLAE